MNSRQKATARSCEKITRSDLRHILELAQKDISDFFFRHDKYGRMYRGQEVLVVLAQGAAQHYIDGKNGVKDFDVWFFFPDKGKILPYRRRAKADFGKSKFGRHPNDCGFAGRRIDILIRSNECYERKNPEKSLINYLSGHKSVTARKLSQKPVIELFPTRYFGKVLWQPSSNK